MKEYGLIQVAKSEALKLATAENELWQLVEQHKYSEISDKMAVLKDETGTPVTDEQGKPKQKPEGEAFILQIDAIIAKKSTADASAFLESEEMQSFFAKHSNAKEGYKQYVAQYEAIGRQTDTLNNALEKAGLSTEEATKASGKIIALVDARYEEGGPAGKNFAPEKIAEAALNTPDFIQRAGTLAARDMLRDAARSDGTEGTISVNDAKTLTPEQIKQLDVDGNGLSKDDLSKVYAGFQDPAQRASAVESLTRVLQGAGVAVADYATPSTANAPRGAGVAKVTER